MRGERPGVVEPRVVSQPWLLEAVGTARWRGTPVAPLVQEAGIPEGAVDVLFTGLDRGVEGGEEQAYERSLPVGALLEGDALLAYEINGVPLPPQHGYPLRLVVPGWYGMTSVKWLSRITVLDEPFAGYQMDHSYRVRQGEDDEGEPITTIAPRSLMVPPGIPEFLTRARVVEAGACELVGRAWSGGAEVAAVDVSTDGGATWASAELGNSLGRVGVALLAVRVGCRARRVRAVLPRARRGRRRAASRAAWNLGGYVNNAVQRVPVTVTP